jgi:hypothetical protein
MDADAVVEPAGEAGLQVSQGGASYYWRYFCSVRKISISFWLFTARPCRTAGA